MYRYTTVIQCSGAGLDPDSIGSADPDLDCVVSSRGADPHHYNADTDPAFTLNADSDTAFYLSADPDPAFNMNADPDRNPAPLQSDMFIKNLFEREKFVLFS